MFQSTIGQLAISRKGNWLPKPLSSLKY